MLKWLCSGGSRAGDPSPLFLDQTEAWKAEKIFLETPFPPPLSEGLDPPLLCSN